MTSRRAVNCDALPLLDLIEQRFDIRLSTGSVEHLRQVCEHYLAKRHLLLMEHGEAQALSRNDYAKAVLISETARMLLREIDPWPRRTTKKGRPAQ